MTVESTSKTETFNGRIVLGPKFLRAKCRMDETGLCIRRAEINYLSAVIL